MKDLITIFMNKKFRKNIKNFNEHYIYIYIFWNLDFLLTYLNKEILKTILWELSIF